MTHEASERGAAIPANSVRLASRLFLHCICAYLLATWFLLSVLLLLLVTDWGYAIIVSDATGWLTAVSVVITIRATATMSAATSMVKDVVVTAATAV